VITRYHDGAVFDPRPVSPALAALELFDNVVVARTAPAAAMAAVTAVARSAPAVRTVRPDARSAASALIDFAGSLDDAAHDTMDRS
jgi:hypothetical protein